ncbi:polyphosphate kinase [Haladaptatus paucihalophilus DX253]|uniref:Polyphosphate kinase n=1 Tax=Haladaptatus paucihalophilus DX253 TaxID=797209 RepID=E7QTB5_HALPU|nr:polyphosphate kinase 1 [Haladaptatus paucihalophilus]EFW91844.1 polyphosphate kinase [Haladaptatus paucihalophilus DX253]SHK80953.1 polyphosphate kinase [Haladaptatus paucihalophilus DX253]
MPQHELPDDDDEETTSENAAIDLTDSEYYLNRELSQLEFQKRVLHEAMDERNPLLERVKFLAIFTTNMDEFFRKRVGGLKQQMAADVTELSPDGRTPREQWDEILDVTGEMFRQQSSCYRDVIHGELAGAGIEIVSYDDLSSAERDDLREYFEASVLPTLTPLTFDPAHPFPFISNLSLSLAVLTRKDDESETTFSRVKIPKNRPRLVRIGDETRYVLLEDVIRANLDLLFPGTEIIDHSTFRVTRNAEVGKDEEVAEDLIDMIESVLRERRFATVVRLEIEEGMPDEVRELLVEQLGVDEREVFCLPEPLDFRDFMDLTDCDRSDLKTAPWTPQPHPRLSGGTPDESVDVFEEIRRNDVLVHHPYHSFEETVQKFLRQAATDPDVLAIKLSIYRTASDSKVVESLIEAAKNGKQVAVMVELKARFDEENNMEWGKKLEEEGIHVAYGTIGYKTHSKTALVVREEEDGVQLYSHIATGNYHSETAKTYTDLGLLTADREIGQDLSDLFNYFTGHTRHEKYRKLLIAPGNMRERFTEMIRTEAGLAREGKEGRIVAKMNSLEDPAIVEELYRAAMDGVDIDLIVRDICRLRPGIEGVSETVDVYSVVGRFLEHSRIFYFGNGGDPRYFIGSADWMTRNLDKRVETITPVTNPALREELSTILETMLADNRNCWVMESDGGYRQRRPGDEPAVATQDVLMRRAGRMSDT